MTAQLDPWETRDAPETDYFLPKPDNPVGSVHESQDPVPKLFQPFKIKNTVFSNRIGVSPMCMYSAAHTGPQIGCATQFHLIHYGSMALRDAGLIIIEASSVHPQGRLSPEDLGIWNDEQARALKPIVDFCHAQGSKVGIQIGHGGRKASGFAMPIHLAKSVGAKYHGWCDTEGTVGPSAISFDEERYVTPHELNITQIKQIEQDFEKAAKRAYDIAGVDFVEIHGAHGYLISSFLSGTSNKRTDEYGGSFANRCRLLLNIVDLVKDETHPLFVRISATELADSQPGAWTVKDSVALSDLLIDHGVDVLDCSAGGNNKDQERRKHVPGSQIPFAKEVKQHVGDKLLVACVGGLASSEAQLAKDTVENGDADIVLAGKGFLKNPGMIWKWADDLNVRLNQARPYSWPFYPPPY